MVKALMLSSAYGWFVGLLVVMIVVTALFGFILWIALRPIKKDEFDTTSPALKALSRRETELTVALLELKNKNGDQAKISELETKLREVKTAEKLVAELLGEDEAPKKADVKKSKPAKPAQAVPKAPVKPAAEPKKESTVAQGAKPAAEPKKETEVKPAAEPVKKPEVKPAEPPKPKAETASKAPAKPAAKPAEKKASEGNSESLNAN